MFRELSAAFFCPGGSITVSHRIDASGVFGNAALSVQARDKHFVFRQRRFLSMATGRNLQFCYTVNSSFQVCGHFPRISRTRLKD